MRSDGDRFDNRTLVSKTSTIFAPPAEGAIMKPQLIARDVLSMELAEALSVEAVRASREIGRNTVIAVCDESGILKAFKRPDGTNLGCVDFAILKARTAVKFNTPTHAHWKYWEGQPQTQIGMASLEGVTVEGGGVPIRVGGTLVGGMGVSGAQHWTEDVDIAARAFERLGFDPPTDDYTAPKP
jgi:uncharacterized protein GlcG (DUF336 family)